MIKVFKPSEGFYKHKSERSVIIDQLEKEGKCNHILAYEEGVDEAWVVELSDTMESGYTKKI